MSRKGLLLLILMAGLLFLRPAAQAPAPIRTGSLPWWEVQSIDAMKFSRDLAREKINDLLFDEVIEDQVSKIAQTGATHVAIGTPYDDEFLPFLWRWVTAAREQSLKVWFRGNFSGWEEWYDYPRISRAEHIKKTSQFILKNRMLFEDGDIFTPCPEAENGGPGDPRRTGDVEGHREFLVEEYRATREAFEKIGRKVRSNFNSMNGDVARLVMDQETTATLGGVVVMDHYVGSVDRLVKDVEEMALRSGGQVVLGEVGVPILDVHGRMSEAEQAEWIGEALDRLSVIPELIGVNYWVSRGSSTQLWNKDGTPRQAVEVMRSFYAPTTAVGVVEDQLGRPISNAKASSNERETVTDKQGRFQLAYRGDGTTLTIEAEGYVSQEMTVTEQLLQVEIEMRREREDLWFRLRRFFRRLLNSKIV